MKTIISITKLSVVVLFCQFLIADIAENTISKEVYVSFEDKQAALGDKEVYKPQSDYTTRSAPEWSVNPGDFEFTSTLTGLVSNEGVQMSGDGDILAAFDSNGQVRGIANQIVPPFGPYVGTTLYELQVYSNAAGDVLSLQYYDSSEDAVLTIVNTYSFEINLISGSATDPIVFEVGVEDLSCPACEDVAVTSYTFDCATAVVIFAAAGGCGFGTLAAECPVTCGTCPEEDACGVCEGDGSSCLDCAGVVDGDAVEDCLGVCGGDATFDCAGTCVPQSVIDSWSGDGWCDDGSFGLDLVSCGDFNCDGGDCGTELQDGDCVASCAFYDCVGNCADGYESYLGDGWCDGTDQAWGLDFSCYDCDAGDCNDECGECEGDGIADGACDCDGNVSDDCGECAGDNACLAGSGLSAIGGLNEVMLQWDYNPSASSYNIYRDGELVCSTPVDMPYYLDDGTCFDQTGWGLGYDTEYCYSVASVGASGSEGASSDDACATTLPQLQAVLDLDLSLANADVAAVASPFGDLTGDGNADAVIMVNMVNFFPVNGYQFNFTLNPGIVDVIAAIDGTAALSGGAAGLTAQLGDGLVLGADLQFTGGTIPPGYPGDGGNEGNLLAILVLSPQYTGSGESVNVTISDFVVSGVNPFTGESVTLNACDADLDPLNGCFDVDSFSTPAADCAGIPSGSSALDECGVCNGDGIADGACDCDGNVLDCADNCGGDAVIDDCGDCDGGNFGDADGDGTCDANDSTPNGEAALSFVNVTSGSADITYDSDVDIYGFQFAVEGVVLTDASSGFDVTSHGNNIVVGFSMEGISLAAGSGGLISLTFEETESGGSIGLVDVIISGSGGSSISASGPSDAVVPGCNNADCFGECGGSAIEDECGVCDGDSSSCADCAGVPNGDSELDDCGVCDGGNADQDCNGDCFGSATIDDCGVCGGDSSSCADCAGVPNGDSELDDCGVCDGGNADQDCNGDCFGSSSEDACGVCDGDGSSCTYGVVQSTEQAIYYFDEASLDGVELTEDDWIVAKNGDVLVGASQYIATNGGTIEIIVMGEDLNCEDGLQVGPVNTCGMMLLGQTPQFYIFDASAPAEHIANYTAADGTELQDIPTYQGVGINAGLTLNLASDCNFDLGGAAVTSGLCGDCWGGNTGNVEDYMDTDGDDVCNDGAANGDDDNCPDTSNNDQADNDGDSEGDACDSDDDNDGCADDVDDDQMTWDDDYDTDGTPDDCDGDDDNDGAADGVDSDDNDEFVCNDDDGDTCDECSSGSYDSSNDGWDYDGDGACDAGDSDDDNDGAADDVDTDNNNEFACSDYDEDGCDDCSSGSYDTSDDGADNDSDGACDISDPDDDNDGCDDDVDDAQFDFDDDYDTDGTPDDCDSDDDNDGAADGVDSDDNNEFVCSDDDNDTCDDCSSGSYDVANDGIDGDSDGTCDDGDPTPGGEITLNFSNATENSIDIEYYSDVSIAGYQFTVEGVDLISASDGVLTVQSANSTVIGFSLTGDSLPAGSGSFASLVFYGDIDGATISLSSILVAQNSTYSLTVYGPGSAGINPCTNFDNDDLCDIDVDSDDDNDLSLDDDDSDDNNPNVCSDDDGDTCDDCTYGSYDTINDGLNNDDDQICDATDPDDDNDGCDDDVDDAQFEFDDDYDTDGTPDDCDSDDDNDGAADDVDSDDNNEFACNDDDGDTCDECSSGNYDSSNDGWDYDGDGDCDAGDSDDDNDGAADDVDSDDNNEFECSDDDNDTCEDCLSGSYDTSNDGDDNDSDGACDAGDFDDDNDGCDDDVDDDQMTWDDDYDTDGTPDDCDDDDDNDGAADDVDSDDNNEFLCNDDDGDTCDECSSGSYDSSNDGWDYDGDGACDAGDSDDDNDGADDDNDSADNNEYECHDDDGDLCDECSSGSEESTSNDGWDYDGDGACDAGDSDDDNDGAADDVDSDDNNEFICSDDDDDTCDDCSSGAYNTADDGPDNESDGACDAGDLDDDNDGCDDDVDDAQFEFDDDYDTDGTPDDCDGDDDNDGAADGVDSDDNNEFVCSDDDNDTCDDCSSGSYNVAGDGVDGDSDGLCDDGDPTPGGEITLSFTNPTETTLDIEYSSDVSIAGYQFAVNGVSLISASDGDLEIYADNNIVVGFGIGVSLPACPDGGCAFASLLFYAELGGADVSLSDILVGQNSDYQLAVSGPETAAIAACTNFDADDLCDIDVDGDDDNDGAADEVDSDDNNPLACSDDDNDTCDDCSDGSYGLDSDGPDNDADGACDAGDSDDDNDGCDDDVDDDQMTWDDDYDTDGTPDDCDGDDDNDGAADGVDSDDNNEFVCNDDDDDTCDECSSGSYDSSNDGTDNDSDGICNDGDDDDDNDGAADDFDSDDNNPFVCSDDDDDLCDDCSDGSYGLDSDGPDFDEDGICDAGDPAAPSVVQTIGAANEVHIGHSHSIHAAQGLAYNIYRDGELVGNSEYGMYTNPAFEAAGGDAGLAYGYVDPDGGWGLEYVTEYCYTVTSVNPAGRESNDASTVSCSTTLPPSPVGLQVTADPDGSIGGVPNAIYVHMVNLWWVSGYQFDISFDTDQVAVAQMIASHPSMDGQLYSDGTTMGFSFSGSQIDPTWYPNPANTYDPVLIAAYVFTPTTDEFSDNITVSLSDWTFGGDEGQLLFASDMEFIHLDGSDVSDAFEYSVDCSGEQYSGEGAAGLGQGSDGWDYTDQCGECDDNALTDCYDLSIDLNPGANLISFPALPVDVSVENIFAGTEGVIGEGIGAINIDGNWIGSLTEVSQDDGYWVKTSSAFTIEHVDADPVNYDGEEVVYSMHVGNNLISYPFQGSQSPDEALGDNTSNVYALVGEGIATLNTEDGWVGSLTALEGERGYWLVSEADFSFTFNGTSSGLARQVDVPSVPTAYEYLQSDQQAFFFVESATIRGAILDSEDLIIAYNGDQVVGSRYWNDGITDVPAIGADSDNSDLFSGYCKEGDVITFKVLDGSTGELIDMDTDSELIWTSMGISLVSMTDIFVPTEVSLGNAYPNPFNPVTMLTYDVPAEMIVNMGVYDVRGRLVDELVQGSHDPGRYEVTWNADQNSSGVYIIKMSAGNSVKLQKVMLVK